MGGETYYTETATTSLAEVALDFINKSTDDGEKAVADQFLLNYNVDIKDGEGTIATVPVKYGTALSEAPDFEEPTKAGHILDWGEFDPSAPVTEDTEVTVNWINVAENLSFNAEQSTKLVDVTYGNEPALVEETDGTKAVEFTYGANSSGRKPATVNLGGTLSVKDIYGMRIRYRLTAGKGSSYWFRVFLNDKTDEGEQVKSLTATVTDEYQTLTFGKGMIAECLGSEDVLLSSIQFVDTSNRVDSTGMMTMRIDSIEFITEDPYGEQLLFNAEDSLSLVTSTYGNAPAFVEEADGTKAVEFSFHTNDAGNKFATIYLGDALKVKDIEALSVRLKVTGGNGGIWYRIKFNDSAKTATNAFTSTYCTIVGTCDKKNNSMPQYATVTFTKAQLTTYFGTDEAYLRDLVFMHDDYQAGSEYATTIRIDWVAFQTANWEINNLQFNSETSLGRITTTHGGDAHFVEETDGTKAAEFSFFCTSGWVRKPATIQLGSVLQVKDVETITIRYKVTAGAGNGYWPRIFLNGITEDANRIGSIQAIVGDYKTLTITQEQLITNLGSEDVYLDKLVFVDVSARADDSYATTIRLDYISFTLAA